MKVSEILKLEEHQIYEIKFNFWLNGWNKLDFSKIESIKVKKIKIDNKLKDVFNIKFKNKNSVNIYSAYCYEEKNDSMHI